MLTTERGPGESVLLSPEGTEPFRHIYGQVRNVASYLQLPLRPLRASASRQEAEDHLVDCVIGLERLLAPDSEALEPTFRFQLQGAALLRDQANPIPDGLRQPRCGDKELRAFYLCRRHLQPINASVPNGRYVGSRHSTSSSRPRTYDRLAAQHASTVSPCFWASYQQRLF
jgi:hypothetical protein